MNIPIITLDKIYVSPDEVNIFFLDCTRISGTNEIVSRKNENLDQQVLRLSQRLRGKKVILADDVIFSGSVLRKIISKLNDQGVKVVGVVSSICTNTAYEYFNNNLKYGVKTNYLMDDNVIDQICERDFYFGIAGSGIMINTDNGLCKAPYFIPYGNPCERASIPSDYVNDFSKGCLERSIYLWNEIDKLKKENTRILDLPEKIVNTEPQEEVVKTLRKELRKI